MKAQNKFLGLGGFLLHVQGSSTYVWRRIFTAWFRVSKRFKMHVVVIDVLCPIEEKCRRAVWRLYGLLAPWSLVAPSIEDLCLNLSYCLKEDLPRAPWTISYLNVDIVDCQCASAINARTSIRRGSDAPVAMKNLAEHLKSNAVLSVIRDTSIYVCCSLIKMSTLNTNMRVDLGWDE